MNNDFNCDMSDELWFAQKKQYNDNEEPQEEVNSLVNDSYKDYDDKNSDSDNDDENDCLAELYKKIKVNETAEDINQWISDRKKSFPSKVNIQKRHEAQVARFNRGERLTANSGRFSRNKNRIAIKNLNRKKPSAGSQEKSNKFQRQTSKAEEKFDFKRRKAEIQSVSVFEDKSDWNGNLPPFRGIKEVFGEEEVEEDKFDIDDFACGTDRVNVPEKIVINNALGSLMSAYNSSEDSELDDILPTVKLPKPKISLPNEVSDDEPPIEEKIVKPDDIELDFEKETDKSKGAESLKNKRKRKRNNCEKFNNSKAEENPTAWDKSQVFKKRNVTLLERLLEKDIIHERNVILQCIRYIVKNNFFEAQTIKNVKVDDENN